MSTEPKVPITLTPAQIYRVIDALESRAAAYEATAAYHAGEDVDVPIEEVDDEDEARAIACDFREVLLAVRSQFQ